jgi:DNA-binding response OmpR family regulator
MLAPLRQTLVRVSSGGDALRELDDRDFAAVLLDVHMPGLDGLETARQVSSRARNRSVPIIFLTSRDENPSYLIQAYRTGIADYLLKPFDPSMVRSKVAVFVGIWRGQEQIRQLEEAIREARRRELELLDRLRTSETEAENAARLSAVSAGLEGRIAGLEQRIAELSELNADLGARAAELGRTIVEQAHTGTSTGQGLRTPISAVLGYSTLLLDNLYGPLTPQQRGGLERMQLAGQQLQELVDGMLDRLRPESSTLDPDEGSPE